MQACCYCAIILSFAICTLIFACKMIEIIGPRVVMVTVAKMCDSVNIPIESHRHVNYSAPKEKAEWALASSLKCLLTSVIYLSHGKALI